MPLPWVATKLARRAAAVPTWLRKAGERHSAFWIQVFVFPLAYIYTLFLDRGEGPNNSFKPRPLRGSA